MGVISNRILQLPDYSKHSTFIWGPRRTGKSYWIKHYVKNLVYIDLLQSDVFAEYASRPALLRERYESLRSRSPNTVIVIDEVQKCPGLLDEVHWLIENRKQSFILTGSSARKLKRAHANLLAGRARRREMRPLCFPEIDGFELDRGLISGLLPPHFLADDPLDEIRGYVADYLKEEIAAEALVQNLPAFSEFLRISAITSSELLNYTNIAREVGVSPKVVRGYFEILEDTLIGFRIRPWRGKTNRRLVETEKFFLFDVGISNYLARRAPKRGTPEFGKAFEHFILMELLAWKAYRSLDAEITFWRTSNRQEVDFIINDKKVAIEVKASEKTHPADAKWLTLLSEDGPVGRRIIVSLDREPKTIKDSYGRIEVLPWQTFLESLWADRLV